MRISGKGLTCVHITTAMLATLLLTGCGGTKATAHDPFGLNRQEVTNRMLDVNRRIAGIVITADILVIDDLGTTSEKVDLAFNKEIGKVVVDTIAYALTRQGYKVIKRLPASVGYSAPKKLYTVSDNSKTGAIMPPFFVPEALLKDTLLLQGLNRYSKVFLAQHKPPLASSELDTSLTVVAFCSFVGSNNSEDPNVRRWREKNLSSGTMKFEDIHFVELTFFLVDAKTGSPLYKITGTGAIPSNVIKTEYAASWALKLLNDLPNADK